MEDIEKPYKKPRRLKAMFLFLFDKERLTDMTLAHDRALSIHDTPGRYEEFLAGTWKPDEQKLERNAAERIAALRKAFFQAGWLVVPSAVAALVLGYFLHSTVGPLVGWLSGTLQGVGAALILWATLWRYPVDAKSIGEKTLPERLHGWVFNALYTVGTFLFFTVYTWQA